MRSYWKLVKGKKENEVERSFEKKMRVNSQLGE
jgi:hypothetical protein